MIRRPPRSTLFPLHDALPICPDANIRSCPNPSHAFPAKSGKSVRRRPIVLLCSRVGEGVRRQRSRRGRVDRERECLFSRHFHHLPPLFLFEKKNHVGTSHIVL